MNGKIGKKISNALKKKNISYSDFASLMKKSETEIEKWLKGEKFPNYKQLIKISTILDIDINNLVDFDEYFFSIKKRNIIIKVLLFIVGILGIFLFIFGYYNHKLNASINDYNLFTFTAKGDTFSLNRGIFTFIGEKKYIYLEEFKLKEKRDIHSLNINITFNDKLWAVAQYDKQEDGNIKDWLNNVKFEEYGSKRFKTDSFVESELSNFPGNMKIEISFCEKNNECFNDILQIEAREIERDNILK